MAQIVLTQSRQNEYGSTNFDKIVVEKRYFNKRTMYITILLTAFLICVVVRFNLHIQSNEQLSTDMIEFSVLPLCVKGAVSGNWNNHLVIFGGNTAINDSNIIHSERVNYIMYYDLDSLKWHVLFGNIKNKIAIQHKEIPKGEWKSSGVMLANYMYIYGGSSGKHRQSESDLMWIFDLQTTKWNNIHIENDINHPFVRSHCMSIYNDIIILFGGKNSSGYDENWLWYFNTNTPINGFIPYTLKYNDNMPGSRQATTCQMIQIKQEWKFVIFGGRQEYKLNLLNNGHHNKTYGYYNDLWLFDVTNLFWIEIIKNNENDVWPINAAHISSAVYNHNKLIVTGGHNIDIVLRQNFLFDFNEYKWLKLKDLPQGQQRCEHVAEYINGYGMVIFGGQYNLPDLNIDNETNKLFNNVLLYNYHNDEWTVLNPNDCKTAEKYWNINPIRF